jgi:hypothetical protein
MLKKCLILLGCALLSGCAVEAVPAAPAGVLVVDWTVSGTKDPAECDASGARDIDVTVSSGGAVVADVLSDCRNFSESITLGPGNYAVDAVMLDAGGNDRTTMLSLGPVTLFGGDQVVLPINFPTSSFL